MGNLKTAAGRPAEEIITKLAQHIDYFNKYSTPHSIQMAQIAATLSTRLGLLRLDIEAIVEAALLHDIGLYEMAPAYLSNPGPLSAEQRMDLWRHSIIGEQAMAKRGASRHSQLLVRWHHEQWNGAGYPDMLSFEEIPIGARVLHAVETYCALLANRPYRSALEPDRALELLRASAGVGCDPFVIRELLALLKDTGSQTAEARSAIAASTAAGVSEAPAATETFSVNEPSATMYLEAGTTAESAPSVQPWAAPVIEPAPVPTPAPETAASVEPQAADVFSPPQPAPVQAEPPFNASQSQTEMSSGAPQPEALGEASRGWLPSPFITGSLLGFQVSVLRQIDFKTVAIPFCGWADLVWYLAALSKQVLSNDPRPWAALAGRAEIAAEGLSEEQIFRILQDTYIPGVRMSNPELRRWFGEADAWWMDNLRRKAMEDPTIQDQTLLLGMRAGDYAQSFGDSTCDLKRPLTVIFRELATHSHARLGAHPYNRAYNLPVQQFLRDARADMMYMNLPAGQADFCGPLARSSWHDTWILGRAPDALDDFSRLATLPQSKKTYLEMVDRMLSSASRIRKWAVECRDIGLASARDISDLIKTHRPIQATYSKDLTEVPGGLRNYIMISEST
jgi:hypothetical protein